MASEFTPDERAALAPYVTNLDGPVFALVNLPEVVKGALFARYSRSPKSLRRLFLDEFLTPGERDRAMGKGSTSPTRREEIELGTAGRERAEQLYERIFVEYGDDSVAQLGGVHLAFEGVSNVGIYGTGQAYEQLLLRMRAHPLLEVRAYADLMLVELRKVIPAFLKRVDLPDRGGAWSAYLAETRRATEAVAAHLLGDVGVEPREEVSLTDFDPDGEAKVVAAALYAV